MDKARRNNQKAIQIINNERQTMKPITKSPYCLIKNKQQFDIKPDHPMYCCRSWIEAWVNHPGVPVSYHPAKRFYFVICDKLSGFIQSISHCLSCNHKFPEDLYEIRSEIL